MNNNISKNNNSTIIKGFMLGCALRFLYGAFPGAILGFILGRSAYNASREAVLTGRQYEWAAYTMGDFISTVVECSLFFGATVLAIYVVRSVALKNSEEDSEEAVSEE